MAIFKEILRNDGSGITRLYRIDNGSITTLDYDALMNKPRINGKELIGDILIDISDFDLSNYYTKKETNTTIQAQLADYYTKKETDNQITKRIAEVSAPEVDLTDYYTKAETEALVEEKIEEAKGQDIDLTDYYTKAETDDKIEEALESIEIPEVEIDPNTWVVDGYNIVEEDPTSTAPIHYTVEPFGSGYGFELREDGAYHALNVGIDNSYAMCKIVFENIGGPAGHFILNFTQKADYKSDYGIISNMDEELIDDLESEEHAQIVLNQGGQIQQPEMMLASYADTTHFIVVKYKKDGEDSYDGEEFSFKVGENGMAVPHILKNKKLVDEDKLNINYYNKEEIDAMFGDAEAALDAIIEGV
jgi:hypothetical protein